ncbi:MAG: HDOD domain-containing protein [Betaproteobacteria bacterium]
MTTIGSTELSEQAERIAREIGIPPCPAILTRFAAEMRAPDPDLKKLAGLTSADAGLSAAIIKTVNAPFYGLVSKATTVQQALTILGLRAAANLVTGLMLRNAFPAGGSVPMQRFWETSARLAQTAATVSRSISGINADVAHTFALFRDCGSAVMIAKFPDYDGVMADMKMRPGAQVLVAEDERFRYSHARVGFALARGWMLPEAMNQAILHHHAVDPASGGRHDADAADARLVAIGLLAEQVVAMRSGRGLCPDWRTGEAFVLETLDLAAEDVVALAQEPLAEMA